MDMWEKYILEFALILVPLLAYVLNEMQYST